MYVQLLAKKSYLERYSKLSIRSITSFHSVVFRLIRPMAEPFLSKLLSRFERQHPDGPLNVLRAFPSSFIED
jgi:hypothetical protein